MLEIEALSDGYGGVPVLNGITIRMKAGEFAAIVGPNGAGKTTLFKTISGTVRPTSGMIRFEGRDLLAVSPSTRPHLGIAHIPEGRQVFPSLTVFENLEAGMSLNEITEVFDVTPEEVRAVLRFAIESLAKAPAFADESSVR